MKAALVSASLAAALLASESSAIAKSPPGFSGILKGRSQVGGDPVKAVKRWEMTYRIRYMFGEVTTEVGFRWWQKPDRSVRVLGRRIKRGVSLAGHRPEWVVVKATGIFKNASGQVIARAPLELAAYDLNPGDGSWIQTKQWRRSPIGVTGAKVTRALQLSALPSDKDYWLKKRSALWTQAVSIEVRRARLVHVHFSDTTWRALSGLEPKREWRTRPHRRVDAHAMKPRSIVATEASVRASPFTVTKNEQLPLQRRHVYLTVRFHRILEGRIESAYYEIGGKRYTRARPQWSMSKDFPVPPGTHPVRVVLQTKTGQTLSKTVQVTGFGQVARRPPPPPRSHAPSGGGYSGGSRAPTRRPRPSGYHRTAYWVCRAVVSGRRNRTGGRESGFVMSEVFTTHRTNPRDHRLVTRQFRGYVDGELRRPWLREMTTCWSRSSRSAAQNVFYQWKRDMNQPDVKHRQVYRYFSYVER